MLLLCSALQHNVNPDMNAVLIFMPINSFHYWRLLYSGVWHHVVWCVDITAQEKTRRWRHQVFLKWWYQYTSLCGMISQMVFIFICPSVRTSDLAHLSLLLQMSSCREISVVLIKYASHLDDSGSLSSFLICVTYYRNLSAMLPVLKALNCVLPCSECIVKYIFNRLTNLVDKLVLMCE